MGATGYLVREELRRRWRTATLLTLVVAVVVATVLTASAGARRSRTAFDRFVDEFRPTEVAIFGGEDEALAGLRDLPHVVAVERFRLFATFPVAAADGESFYPMLGSVDGLVPEHYLRHRVIEGRLAKPDEAHEIVLNERTARLLGIEAGDELPMLSLTPEQAVANEEEGGDPGDPAGPTLTLRVVGIVRHPADLVGRETDLTLTWLTPAFTERYAGRIGQFDAGAFVDLDDPAALGEFSAAARGLGELQIDPQLNARSFTSVITPIAKAISTGLLVFAAVAGLAGLVAIALSFARSFALSRDDDQALSAIGCGVWARRARFAAPAIAAAIAGSLLGGAASVALSPLHPIGVMRRAEPDPGVDVDTVVLVMGATLAVLTIAAIAVIAAVGATRPIRVRAVRPSRTVTTAAEAGAPVPVITGLLFALRKARTAGTAPIRAVGVGVAAGVLGLSAALVFAASTDRLLDSPDLYGWSWDAQVEGAELSDVPPGAVDVGDLVADDDLEGVAQIVMQLDITTGDGETVFGMMLEDIKGHTEPVIARGDVPVGPDDVAFGRDTLDRLELEVGDEVELGYGDASDRFRIVGVAVLPTTEDGGTSAEGVAMTAEAMRSLGWEDCSGDSSCFRNVAVTLADGVSVEDIVARYSDEEADLHVSTPRPPPEVERLREIRRLPWLLSAFLIALALIVIAHGVGTTVRRRRRDLAVLRTLGLTGSQLRGAVSVQAAVLVGVGGTVGLAAGVILGRQIWHAVTEGIGLPSAPTLPLLAIVLIPLVTLLLAELVAAVPGRAAARLKVAQVLRTE